ncbi:hypothetical protein BH11PLA2_BH11PLA2_36010 [soil metagenome]
MASLTRNPNGTFRILLVCSDKKRRTIRLGKVSQKTAADIHKRVEHLHELVMNRLTMDTDTAAWMGSIGDELAEKLSTAGLIPARQSRTLGTFLEDYTVRRKPSAKPATMVNLGTVANDLTGHFGPTADLRSITVEKADRFKTHYQTRKPKLSTNTVARRLRTVKMLFSHAVRWNLIPSNPFADVSASAVVPTERRHYVTVADTRKLLAVCNPTWRMIIALARFAGLRTPSETLSLKWSDVNFETNRITVPSPKTEHIEGKAYRVIPIFADLKPFLEEAFELAEDGAVYVVGGKYREAANSGTGWKSCNLRTQMLKLIKRAGLQPWPKLLHNLRASQETDLMQDHPINVVCSWLGNTPTVALKHYLQTLDRDFEKAVNSRRGTEAAQYAAQSGRDSERHEPPTLSKSPSNSHSCRVQTDTDVHCHGIKVGRLGVEPSSKAL